ncbi:MAG: pyroglutamyl-peptidase I [Chloroflexota bacterium]|nr:pyroglutamyl-peptidase I [Chloroflexota bacterium]
MKVLLTGFEPFGRWQRNPSGEVARHLNGATIIDVEITGLVLPVSFKRASAPLIAAIDALQPDVVLNLGQGDPVGVRVERVAVNRCIAPPGGDNDGYDPQGQPVVVGGPETYPATLPVSEIVELLSNVKFQAAASDSAGEFLCNYIMYTTLHHIATQQLSCRAGFIHASPLREEVPDLTAGKGMRLKKWIEFTEAVVYLLRTPLSPAG